MPSFAANFTVNAPGVDKPVPFGRALYPGLQQEGWTISSGDFSASISCGGNFADTSSAIAGLNEGIRNGIDMLDMYIRGEGFGKVTWTFMDSSLTMTSPVAVDFISQ